jgi:hypothetical protein
VYLFYMWVRVLPHPGKKITIRQMIAEKMEYNKKWFEFEYENEREANELKNIRERRTKEENGRRRERVKG